MEQRFKLHAHEVWREELVREGVYEHSGDFAGALPTGVWDDSRFVWSRYSARHGEGHLFGHLLFRPEQGGAIGNFFVGAKASIPDDTPPSRPGEFFFGDQGTGREELESALALNHWGRVFYFDDEGLRFQKEERPCDWGLFLSASGLGLWKWTMRDGIPWGKASSQGLFRWHPDPAEAARFLAQTPSLGVWTQLQGQLENPDSELAFTRRWLQLEEQERLDALVKWARGSRAECEWVLHALATSDEELQGVGEVTVCWSMMGEDDAVWLHDEDDFGSSPRLQDAFTLLRSYFDVQLTVAELPMCVEKSDIEWQVLADIQNPTAHERLEAQLQLGSWAKERGLSFD